MPDRAIISLMNQNDSFVRVHVSSSCKLLIAVVSIGTEVTTGKF